MTVSQRQKQIELRNRILALVAALLVFLFVVSTWASLRDGMPKDAPEFLRTGLSIEKQDGEYVLYSVEVATTPEQERYGLMFRKKLPPRSGMIFLYYPEQQIFMWMKNTYIPLDMLFVRADGTISKIIADAMPMDATPLSSDAPVRAVIEINAGEAAGQGIKVGDKVLFAAFESNKDK